MAEPPSRILIAPSLPCSGCGSTEGLPIQANSPYFVRATSISILPQQSRMFISDIAYINKLLEPFYYISQRCLLSLTNPNPRRNHHLFTRSQRTWDKS